jgi:rhodanese-related sulfurtransferase
MKIYLLTSFILVFTFVSYQGKSQDTLKYQSLEPYDFHLKYLNEDPALLIDVRESFEFRSKRIKGSINIPASGNINRAADTLNKNCALFLYCTSGTRSKRVAASLYNKGFRKLYSLDGGIMQWQKGGMKVDRSRVKKGTNAHRSEAEIPLQRKGRKGVAAKK